MKQKKLYSHYLQCVKCKFTFSIESPEKNNTRIGVDKLKCPLCGKAIQLDPAKFYGQGKESEAQKSHINAEASKEAMRMAMQQKRIDSEMGDNQEIEVISTQEGRNKGKPMKISKKIIDSIEEKVAPLLEE